MGYNLQETKKAFDPLPADRYTLKIESTRVESHQKGETKGERIEITYRIVDGSFANRKVWENVYVPWALWKARGILEAGNSKAATSPDITADGIAKEMMGLEMTAYIETEIGEQDKIRTNVREHRPIETGSSLLK